MTQSFWLVERGELVTKGITVAVLKRMRQRFLEMFRRNGTRSNF
jgi:hypothetical protein